jgi:formate dehydrogenase alpha subunit
VTTSDDTYCNGNLCINGRYGFAYINSAKRLTTPLVNQNKADWNQAMTLAAGKLKEIIAANGPDAVAGLTSPRLTNEEQFLFQKLFRTALGSNNIDSEARFGYAPAQAVIAAALGTSGATNTMDRIENAGAVLVVGSNLNAEATGYEYRVIKAATRNNAKLVLANAADVKLKKIAHGQLKYRPGSETLLLNGLAKLVLEAGLEDKTAVAGIANFTQYQAGLAKLSLDAVVAATGVTEAALRASAALMGGKQSVAVIFGGELMRSVAPGAVEAVVNLALLVGAIGKEQGGLFPLHEKINIQGLLDMGVTPDFLPGGKAAPTKGRDLWQIVEGIEQGKVKALYLVGVDPLTSFPEGARVRKALEKLELLIVQDLFPTATAALAHVVLPATSSAEKSGTFTTIDGRLQKVAKALSCSGDAREDWDILTELYDRVTGKSVVAKPAQLLAEIKAAIPGYGETPAAPKGPFTFAVEPTVDAPATTGCTLLVGPILFHNGATSTWSENNLEVSPAPYVEIQAADAAKLGIADGGAIKLTTVSGSLTGTAKITDRLQPGLLFAPYHFPEFPVSGLLSGNATTVAAKVEKG